MRWWILIALALSPWATDAAEGPRRPVAGEFTILAYHEVQRDVRDFPDPYSVDAVALARQFAWLRGAGYVPVALEDIVAARQGGAALPAKAVLLSFDDAYASFYTRVYPLLREFGYPAVLGVVGSWIGNRRSIAVRRGRVSVPVDTNFATWEQLREMAASGLVELASHSFDLHHGVPGNPQGNLQPAATTRIYDAATGYEDDERWRARVRADLARNSELIARETGRRPRAIAWPYGSYNEELVGMAAALGMPIALTLEDGVNTPEVPLAALRRTLIERNPTLAEFTVEQRGPLYREPLRVMQVDLARVHSANPAWQERNLSALLDRVKVLEPTHVFLRAVADTDGDGVADAAWFPNRHLPLRADLFNRAAWQLATRNDVKVYAVLPEAGLRLPPEAVAELYEDLARHANFDGLVFDDTRLTEGAAEAEGPAFTGRIAARVRAFRAPLKTVRATASAQAVAALAGGHDYVALLRQPDPLAVAPALRPRVIFLLESRPEAGNGGRLNGAMRALQLGGGANFGYAADDFLHDNPRLDEIAPSMSLRVYPQADAKEAP